MKINAKIQKFMNGKYGPDQLYILLIISNITIAIIKIAIAKYNNLSLFLFFILLTYSIIIIS